MLNRKVLILIPVLILFMACGARLPKSKTAEHTLNRYFHKYGHKFKASEFGKGRVTEIQVLDIEEIHKGLAAVTASIQLSDGPIYKTKCFLQKKPLRWKVVSWEKM